MRLLWLLTALVGVVAFGLRAEPPEVSACRAALQRAIESPPHVMDLRGWQDYVNRARERVWQMVSEPERLKRLQTALGTADREVAYSYVLNGIDLNDPDYKVRLPVGGSRGLTESDIMALSEGPPRRILHTSDVESLLREWTYNPPPTRQWLKEYTDEVFPSRERAQQMLPVALIELLEAPENASGKLFVENFSVPLPSQVAPCDWHFDVWQERRLHNQRDRYYAALNEAARTTSYPWKACFQALLRLTLARDHAKIRQAVRTRITEDPVAVNAHPYADWLGDFANPSVMDDLGELLDTKPAKFIDIGSGTGEPLLILSPRFPQIEFTGYDIVPEKTRSANQLAAELGLKNASFVRQDLADPAFRVPAADYYYFFAPVNGPTFRKVLDDIVTSTAQQERTVVILRSMNPGVVLDKFQADHRICKLQGHRLLMAVVCERVD